MGLEELEKLLAEQESILQNEFVQIRKDLKDMQDSFDALEQEIKEEEAFIQAMEATIKSESSDLESRNTKDVVSELVKKEGSVKQALEKIDAELEKISGVSSKIADRWDGNADLEVLISLVEEFEVLKKRYNQVDKRREVLISQSR